MTSSAYLPFLSRMYFIWLYALVGYENNSMNIVIIYNRLANKFHVI